MHVAHNIINIKTLGIGCVHRNAYTCTVYAKTRVNSVTTSTGIEIDQKPLFCIVHIPI